MNTSEVLKEEEKNWIVRFFSVLHFMNMVMMYNSICLQLKSLHSWGISGSFSSLVTRRHMTLLKDKHMLQKDAQFQWLHSVTEVKQHIYIEHLMLWMSQEIS